MNKRELQRMIKAKILYAMDLPIALLLALLALLGLVLTPWLLLPILILGFVTYESRMRGENTTLVILLELTQYLLGLAIILLIAWASWQFGLMLGLILVGWTTRRFIISRLKAVAWIIYKFRHRHRNRKYIRPVADSC